MTFYPLSSCYLRGGRKRDKRKNRGKGKKKKKKEKGKNGKRLVLTVARLSSRQFISYQFHLKKG